MTLDEALAELRRVTPENDTWVAEDFPNGDDPRIRPIDHAIAAILNAVLGGSLLTPEALAASPEVAKLVAEAEARGMERAQSLARRLANDSEREAERKDTTAQQRIGLNLVRDTAATLESAIRAEAAAIRRAAEETGT